MPPSPPLPGASGPGSLPADVTRFIGRRRELAETRQALENARVVTLTGPGGVGKSRLAVQAARDVQRAYRAGVRVVWLAETREPTAFGHALNTALGIQERGTRWHLQTVIEQIGDRHLLLVLDNCEHVIDDAAHVVDALLRACPHLQVLATSRQALNILGETIMPVLPLATDGGNNEALQLFLDRARNAVPSLVLNADDEPVLRELCDLLDGIPLALELAAVRLRTVPLAELRTRMADRFAVLDQGSRAATPRHQTLRAAIDWTYDLCTEAEQLLWQRLTVFTGGFSLEAAAAVTTGDGVEPSRLLNLITGLIDKSVISLDTEQGIPRYRILETIREYAATRLNDAESDRLRERHRAWFVEFSARAGQEWAGSEQPLWLRRLAADQANMRTALASCLDHDPGAGIRLVVAVENHWLARGHIAEAREWLARLGDRTLPDSVEHGLGLRLDAWLAVLQGDHAAALERLAGAAEIAQATQDPELAAFVVQTTALRALFGGDLDEARALLPEALTRFESLGHQGGVIHTLFELALVHDLANLPDEAAVWHERCQRLTGSVGELWWRSFSFWSSGIARWRDGAYVEALTMEQTSLRLKVELGDRLGIGVCLEAMAWIAVARGEGERAARLLGAADALLAHVGMPFAGIEPMWPFHVAGENSARRLISEAGFRSAYATGAAMTVEEAVRYALDEDDAVPAPPEEAVALTRRELEVAVLIGEGLTNREIATHLVISVRTAEKHVDRILRKLGVANRVQIARWLSEREAQRASST